MTKEQFLNSLDTALRKLPKEDREEIKQDFMEHFLMGEAEGKSEKEIIAALGSPQQIGKEMAANYYVDQMETQITPGSIFKAIWAIIGLGFFNLVIVLGPLIGILGILLGGWIAGMAFVLSPLLVLVNVFVYPGSFEFFDLFVATGLSGLGIFISIGMYFATKAIIFGLIRYLKFNISLVKGGLNA